MGQWLVLDALRQYLGGVSSVGARGDSFDKGSAESVIGLYKSGS